MDISAGLIAKAGAGTAALAATTTTGIVYGDTIAEFLGISKTIDEGQALDQSQSARDTGKASLGLPGDCSWTTNDTASTTCTLDESKLKAINFDGKGDGGLTISGDASDVTLEIKKTGSESEEYKNYTFIFKTQSENGITISGGSNRLVVLKKDMNLEFKIKNESNKWSLEKVWNNEEIKTKIGLNCGNNNECTLESGKNIVFKQGSNESNEISTLNLKGSSKIKLYKDEGGYNQGLRFNIEGADIDLTGGGANVTKLEKNESYQIAQDSNKWLLLKKNTAIDGVNEKLKKLGFPDGCELDANNNSKSCGKQTESSLQKINFEGRRSDNLTIAGANGVTLKLEKSSNKKIFPNGVKIVFENTENVEMKNDSSAAFVDWKTGTNPEYKIDETGSSLVLKRAWTAKELAQKIHLKCQNSPSTECNFGTTETEINVLESGNKLEGAKVLNGKITFEENQENYNQGFRFTVKDADIDLKDGTNSNSSSPIEKLHANAGYEIIKRDSKWYLSKKT